MGVTTVTSWEAAEKSKSWKCKKMTDESAGLKNAEHEIDGFEFGKLENAEKRDGLATVGVL